MAGSLGWSESWNPRFHHLETMQRENVPDLLDLLHYAGQATPRYALELGDSDHKSVAALRSQHGCEPPTHAVALALLVLLGEKPSGRTRSTLDRFAGLCRGKRHQ